jgi:hypothetical protein
MNKPSVNTRQWHELKTEYNYFIDVEKGLKNFELRYNDRNFKVGDSLTLKEIVTINKEKSEFIYTGRTLEKYIVYIFEGPGFGVIDGWVVLGLGDCYAA